MISLDFTHPPLHLQCSVHLRFVFLQLHLLEHFFLHLHRMSSLREIDVSGSIIQIGFIDPLLLSSHPHSLNLIGGDNLSVASHHILAINMIINQ